MDLKWVRNTERIFNILNHQGNEMCINTTLKFHLIPVRIAKANNTSDSSLGGSAVEHGEHSFIIVGGTNLHSNFGNHKGGSTEK